MSNPEIPIADDGTSTSQPNFTLVSSSTGSNEIFKCISHSQCGDLGRCVNGTCICRSYLEGAECEIPYSTSVGQSFHIYRYVFLSVLVILLAYASYNCYRSFLYWKIKKVAYKLKAITHVVIILFCIFRIIYLGVDPWSTLGIFPFPLSMFLYHFPLYILFTAYQLLLLYWSGTYHNVATLEKGKLFVSKTKPVVLALNTVWLVLEVMEIVAVAYNNSSDSVYIFYYNLTIVYNVYISLTCIFAVVCFIVYGCLLYKRIKSLPANKQKKKKTLRKLMIITSVLATSIIMVIVPTLVLYFTKSTKRPYGVILFFSFVHSIECLLVAELLIIMKPRTSMPFQSNAPGYITDANNPVYLDKYSKPNNNNSNNNNNGATEQPKTPKTDSPKKTSLFLKK